MPNVFFSAADGAPDGFRRGMTRWLFGCAAVLLILSFAYARGVRAEEQKRPASHASHHHGAVATIAYPSGPRAELLGIAPHPREGLRPWGMDGKKLDAVAKGFEDLPGGAMAGASQMACELHILIRGLPDALDASVRAETMPPTPGARGFHNSNRKDGQIWFGLSIAFPVGTTHTTLRLGLASGRWQTLATATPAGGTVTTSHTGKSQKIILGKVERVDKAITLRADYPVNLDDQDCRVIAIDQSGRPHPFRPVQGTINNVTSMCEKTYALDELPAGGVIQRVEFQVRNFEWGEIRNIPLQPREGRM